MKTDRIEIDSNRIYYTDDDGVTRSQSLLPYYRLMNASEEEQKDYEISAEGIHWPNIGEDISFESFDYPEPSPLQVFFYTHRELKISAFAKRMGINPTLLHDYVNGFKKPSEERKQEILAKIHKYAEDLKSVQF